MPASALPNQRPVDLGPLDIALTPGGDGVLYARSPIELGSYEDRVTLWLDRWAALRPDQIFLAEREASGVWARITYAQARAKARRLASALLARGLSAEWPLVILSGNSIAHALLGLAALYAGIPYAPISPAYALAAPDFTRLKSIFGLLTPGLVFAEDGAAYAQALAVAPETATRLVASAPPLGAELLSDLLATPETAALDRIESDVGPRTIAKFMFTSGSTAAPKAVITTQRMLCANQAMIARALRFLASEPPVLLDWLPWSHSFGGNQNFNLVLAHGGTLYIDAGRPTPDGIAATLANLREISPTLHFNVPAGIEMLLPHLAREKKLATNFFRHLRLTFFAGAPIGRATYETWNEAAAAACGETILAMSGYGATESGPATTFWTPAIRAEGGVGLPLPGAELKLTPRGEKLEVRVKGPNVTPGYWRDPDATQQAFDDEGFFRLGDALRLADAAQPRQGFCFDGRVGEDFKLATGTWVSTGPLREACRAALAPFAQDVVLTGAGQPFAGAFVFPNFAACKSLGLDPAATPVEIVAHPKVRAKFQALLDTFASATGGSSRRIARLILLSEPASAAAGELTDKQALNAEAVLTNRADLLPGLFSATPPAQVIIAAATPAEHRQDFVIAK
ncbi:feruloyl-CoA synthase [Methylovirgula ligni]|uniref:Feruloyl-CoA synthase n=1 Tax=Methylovirgula ligni TaxID=569860 RepID=A0A3D9Z4I0_9HYPH|nr:feruloyl-CoA synthase [Methylovirgula ligni]QAY95473.1 feruloyl-CoA synthase [Methylovirgula ligni]REF89198.1 feruloyl-CoA synthase [Methylovirgula ligni]